MRCGNCGIRLRKKNRKVSFGYLVNLFGQQRREMRIFCQNCGHINYTKPRDYNGGLTMSSDDDFCECKYCNNRNCPKEKIEKELKLLKSKITKFKVWIEEDSKMYEDLTHIAALNKFKKEFGLYLTRRD